MNPTVTVIGTIFIDCKGFAANVYRAAGRNLGQIQFVHGGVGRNVAENLASLQLNTTFVSTLDSTGMGREVSIRLQKSGINTNYLQERTHGGMGMWLAILDEKGNLAGSISQMPNLDYLDELLIAQADSIIRNSDHIVLELDLNETISRRIVETAARYNKPVYGIPGNLDVILKHPDLLHSLDCFICNDHEAGRLLNEPLEDASPERLIELLKHFVDSCSMRSMVITLGEKGSVFYDSASGSSGYQPVFPVELKDSSGAGDAFFSGTIMGLIRRLSLRDAVICGTKVAGWTIESAESTCLDLAQKAETDSFFQGIKALK